jgi:hypothetical protein
MHHDQLLGVATQRQQLVAALAIGAWQWVHTRAICRLRTAQSCFAGACAPVAGAGAGAGSATTGVGARDSTMNLSPRSQARSLASGPRARVGVFSIVTTFR